MYKTKDHQTKSLLEDLSNNSGSTWTHTITEDTPNDGSYTWQLGDTTSDSCRIGISELDGEPWDMGDLDFKIK